MGFDITCYLAFKPIAVLLEISSCKFCGIVIPDLPNRYRTSFILSSGMATIAVCRYGEFLPINPETSFSSLTGSVHLIGMNMQHSVGLCEKYDV